MFGGERRGSDQLGDPSLITKAIDMDKDEAWKRGWYSAISAIGHFGNINGALLLRV